jgi:uncharacterized protein YceH (UPF0502 family)
LITLTDVETRVLGSLIEKSLTTPEYYPMSPNAVMNACNQKSSREPVRSYDETTVIHALFSLRDKGLAWERSEAGSRVTKYAHRFENMATFTPADVAALCLLMLRGPQTSGEIKSRSGRLHEFATPAEVESTLNGLMTRADGPFVAKLPRQTGHKEARYAQLLSGEPLVAATPAVPASAPPAPLEERIAALEAQVASLTAALAALNKTA